MKFSSVLGIWLRLVALIARLRQGVPGVTGSSRGTLPGATLPTAPSPSTNSPNSTTAFISGKVALDDGSELSDSAAIQVTCATQRHTEAYTDRRGNFSFQF